MMKWKISLLAFLFALAGCTDNMDSITREYRNANNEVIDAMMMITTEEHAARMNVRIFKPMSARYAAIDKKLYIFGVNRATNFEMAQAVLESDGVQLYLTDLQVNSRRFSLERLRLRNLFEKYVKESGEEVEEITPKHREIAPNLYDITYGGNHPLNDTIQKQFTASEVVKLILSFPNTKGVKDNKGFDALYMKFAKKREVFSMKIPPLVE
jgi:hypothetical protein